MNYINIYNQKGLMPKLYSTILRLKSCAYSFIRGHSKVVINEAGLKKQSVRYRITLHS